MAVGRNVFGDELDGLQRQLVRAAAMVTDWIPRGAEVLVEGDLAAAQAIIDADDELDALSLDIEEHAFQLMALQQPTASDLRALITAIKVNGEIERSGDLVVNIAKAARRMYGSRLTPRCRGIVERMSEECVKLNKLAVDAYVERDDSLAAALDDLDDRLDGLNKQFIQAIFEAHHDGDIDLQAAVQLALCGRYFERIGDHAVNIGERVRFMVTGWMPEHTGAARARARRELVTGPDDVATSAGDDT